MPGKRTEKPNRRWGLVPGLLAVSAAALLIVMPLTGSADAGNSPAAEAQRVQVQPEENPAPWALRPPSVAAMDPFLPDLHPQVFRPVLEQAEPVGDDYFDGAAFLGDSRTEGFQLYSGLNRGSYYFSVGANVATAVERKTFRTPQGRVSLADALAAQDPKPERIYVMLGVNELGWVGEDNFHRRYGTLIDRLRADNPDADIVLQSIIPVTAEQEAKGTYVNNRRISRYNRVIRALAREKQVWFLDVGQAVAGEDGFLPKELSVDGVHLNSKGCKLWLECLREHPVP